MVDLWHRLAVASDKLQGEEEEDVEGLTISEMGAAVRLLPPAEEEDEEFPIDMNILVLSCPDAVETLQVCLTNVMRVQQATLSSYLPLILRKVQTVALLQLGGGETPLKASTLDLLSAFHTTSGPLAPDLWAGVNKKPEKINTFWHGFRGIFKLFGRVNQASLILFAGFPNTVCWTSSTFFRVATRLF